MHQRHAETSKACNVCAGARALQSCRGNIKYSKFFALAAHGRCKLIHHTYSSRAFMVSAPRVYAVLSFCETRPLHGTFLRCRFMIRWIVNVAGRLAIGISR